MELLQIVPWLYLYISTANSFYMPANSPVTYCKHDGDGDHACSNKVKVYRKSLKSQQSMVTYDYSKVPMCPSLTSSQSPLGNLGEMLTGNGVTSAPFEIEYLQPVSCRLMCQSNITVPSKADMSNPSKSKAEETTRLLLKAIEQNYGEYWSVDDLPAKFCYELRDLKGGGLSDYCTISAHIGCYIDQYGDGTSYGLCPADAHSDNTHYLYNHMDLRIYYHPLDGAAVKEFPHSDRLNAGRITDVRIAVSSTQQVIKDDGGCDIYSGGYYGITIGESSRNQAVYFTYSVTWVESEVLWSHRWDSILKTVHSDSLMFSIINSSFGLVVMTILTVFVLKRLSCNTRCTLESQRKKELGYRKQFEWTLMHGDLLAAPSRRMLVSLCVGQGLQFTSAALLTLCISCLGVLSPANPGSLVIGGIVCYVSMGTVAGLSSAKIYRMFGGEKWKSNASLTALVVPGVFYIWYIVINLVLSMKGSSSAVPIRYLAIVFSLWMFVSVPLTFMGAYFAVRRSYKATNNMTDDSLADIPRNCKKQSKFKQMLLVVFGSIFPFSTIFLQLYFILTGVWSDQVFYSYGYLTISSILMVLLSVESSIMIGHQQLRFGITQWHTRTLATGMLVALYVFIYSIRFLCSNLSMRDPASIFIYLSYNLMISIVFFLAIGGLYFLSTLWFLKRMHRIIQVEYKHQPLSLDQDQVLTGI